MRHPVEDRQSHHQSRNLLELQILEVGMSLRMALLAAALAPLTDQLLDQQGQASEVRYLSISALLFAAQLGAAAELVQSHRPPPHPPSQALGG